MDFGALAVGPAPQLPLDAFERRRRRAAEALGEGKVLVVATHPEATYSRDVEYPFRPHNDLWYLTGFAEPGAVLVLEGGSGAAALFLRPRRPEAEIWTGRRLGAQRAVDALGVDRAFSNEELARRLPALVGDRTLLAVTEHHPEVHEAVRNAVGEAEDGAPLLAMQRMRKDPAEVALMQKAADVGVDAFLEALPLVRPGRHEYEVEAALLHGYRARGSTGPGYPPIVGSGANAAVLHYTANRDPIGAGDLVLIDAGCEWGYYNSDITRTHVAGDADGRAREVHALVLEAQEAALREVRPGNRFRDPHDAAVRVLTEGLVEQGLLDDVDKALDDHSYRRFFMHGTSHLLGLDVHDVGQVKHNDGNSVLLEPGMALTVEPGLYFNPDFTACPDGYAGIGVRIEDDVVVTEDGHQNLTARLPRGLEAGA